jgi:hypothetical protein
MWLARWAVREHRRRPQYEDLLSAVYLRAWKAAEKAVELGLSAEEVAKRITKAAGWAAADWLRSGDHEARTERRSNSQRVLLPERVPMEQALIEMHGFWVNAQYWNMGEPLLRSKKRPGRHQADQWVERLCEGVDDERGR